MNRVKYLLQGRPLGHPLHPLLNHFPIALFLASFLFDIASLFTPSNNTIVRASFYAMSLGAIMGLLAAGTGLADYAEIRADHPARRYAVPHMALNLAMLVLYGVNLNVRLASISDNSAPLLGLALSVLGVAAFTVGGYLGGKMVYDDGIGVGRHLRPNDLPHSTIVRRSRDNARPDGFVPVAQEAALPEGETLRVSVDNKVMSIAKIEGRPYAFQEFCTHRYGPLSEGSLHGFEVQCPWHRSCFDVRTGKVTQGPAKVDLNTYGCKVESGQILVRVEQDQE